MQKLIDDALSRFRVIYPNENIDIAVFNPVFQQLEKLSVISRFSFHPDQLKARFSYNGKEFSLDYDECLLVSTFIGDKLYVKDGTIENLKEILESFDLHEKYGTQQS
jgi:hypothetical protein